MKSWRRTLAIGFIIAVTSQLCVSVGYSASGADYDSRKSDSHDDDLYGDVDHCFFIPNCDILSAGNAIRDAGTACDARSVLLYRVRHDVQAADPE